MNEGDVVFVRRAPASGIRRARMTSEAEGTTVLATKAPPTTSSAGVQPSFKNEDEEAETEAKPIQIMRSSASMIAKQRIKAQQEREKQEKQPQKKQPQQQSEYSAERLAELRRETYLVPPPIGATKTQQEVIPMEDETDFSSATTSTAEQRKPIVVIPDDNDDDVMIDDEGENGPMNRRAIARAKAIRQAARSEGEQEEGFIPLEQPEQQEKQNKERKKGEIVFMSDVQQKEEHRRKVVENQIDQVNEMEEEDPEVRKWMLEQMKKGTTTKSIQEQQKMKSQKVRKEDAISFGALSAQEIEVETEENVCKRISQSLEMLKAGQKRRESDLIRITSEIEETEKAISTQQETANESIIQHEFFKDLQEYIANLIDLLGEKAQKVEDLETQMIQMEKEYAMNNRMIWENRMKKALQVSSQLRSQSEEEKESKVLEFHFEIGDDFKDFDSSFGQASQNVSQEDSRLEIIKEAKTLFEDVEDDFKDIRKLLNRFLTWKQRYLPAYRQAYCSLMLPMLLSPLVRYELLSWQPLLSPSEFESMEWYKAIKEFSNTDNEDKDLLTTIIEGAIFPRVLNLISFCWNPFIHTQNQSVLKLVSAVLAHKNDLSEHERTLLSTVQATFQTAIEHNVYLSEPRTPWNTTSQRLFYQPIQLLKHICEWNTTFLTPISIQKLAIESLITMKLLPYIKKLSNENASVASELIASCFSIVSLECATKIAPSLALFAEFVTNLSHSASISSATRLHCQKALSFIWRS